MTKPNFKKKIITEVREYLFKQLETKLLLDNISLDVILHAAFKMYIDEHPEIIKYVRMTQENEKIFPLAVIKKMRKEDKEREKIIEDFSLSQEEIEEIFDLEEESKIGRL